MNTNKKFPENTTANLVNLSKIKASPELIELMEKLNCSMSYSMKSQKNSIMHHDQFCNHDTGWLCECRLQYIVDYVTKHGKSLAQ